MVVTGGCGFVGQRIVHFLLESDPSIQVVVFDVVVPAVRHERVEYVRGSISILDHVRQAFKGADSVIHTASIIPSVKMQGSRALEIVNVDGTRNVIAACQELGIPRIVYTSSATVVGKAAGFFVTSFGFFRHV